jgi:hypothetical protein
MARPSLQILASQGYHLFDRRGVPRVRGCFETGLAHGRAQPLQVASAREQHQVFALLMLHDKVAQQVTIVMRSGITAQGMAILSATTADCHQDSRRPAVRALRR